jgi:hypothetical protein
MPEQPAAIFTGRQVSFTLPYATPVLNDFRGLHWSKLTRKKRALAFDVKVLVIKQRPPEPFKRAQVEIIRFSSGSPDEDGLIGGAKMLIDCLLPPGRPYLRKGKWIEPHPGGQSIIVDDNRQVMDLVVKAERIKRTEKAKTSVVVREMA